MADIFLSYAAVDRERVRPLVASLEADGWSVWWDRHIDPGEVWDREIEQAVDEASCVIVVWSQASVASAWVRSEANEGLSKHRLVPVLIDHVRPPMAFRSIQSSYLVGWPSPESQHELSSLLTTVRRIIESEKPTELGRGQQTSVAVLPFANLSPDPEQEYLSDGLAEELLNLLARLPELRVVARTSAFSFKGKDLTATQIGRELQVTHLIEGSLRKAGERVRISVQFIRADDGFQIWSESYDRTLGDIFAIQDDIAQEVVNRLKLGLLSHAPASRKIDAAAYALFLQANHLAYQGAEESSAKAIGLLERALEIEDQYVEAWVALARMYLNQAALGQRPFAEGHRLAESTLRKALAMDPNNPKAHCTLAGLRFDENDVRGAAEHLREGLALNPTDEQSLRVAGDILSCLGEERRAIELLEFLSRRDPVNPSVFSNLASGHYLARRWDSAIAALDVADSLSPQALGTNALRSLIFVLRSGPGDLERGLACAKRERLEGFRLEALAIAQHAIGQRRESAETLLRLMETCGTDWGYNIARVCAFRGDVDQAFDWLARAIDAGDSGLAQARVDPVFSHLAADPRWEQVLETLGLSTDQLSKLNLDFDLPF